MLMFARYAQQVANYKAPVVHALIHTESNPQPCQLPHDFDSRELYRALGWADQHDSMLPDSVLIET